MGKKILILGGYGTYGRRISHAIANIPDVTCVIGGHRNQFVTSLTGGNISTVVVNINDTTSLRRALDGVFAVVNTVGPFQGRDYTVAEVCSGRGIHYVDLADARTYVLGITRLQRRASQKECLVVSGASAMPAVSSALVEMLASEFDRIDEIHVSLSPGNKNPLGLATARAYLSYTGIPFRIKEQGRWRYAYGWSESQKIAFPKPVGKRRVYMCEVPDLDIFPTHFGAQTVTFRAGMELSLFNHGLATLGKVRRWGWIKNLMRWAPGLMTIGQLFRAFGSVSGGMLVQVRGWKNDQELEHTAYLIARDTNGPAISCSPAIALIRQWVERGVPETGALPCVGLLSWNDIRRELVDYDITLVRQ